MPPDFLKILEEDSKYICEIASEENEKNTKGKKNDEEYKKTG